MASASPKQFRVLVRARGHAERYWAEQAGRSERGDIELRFARVTTPAGLFSRRDAHAVAKRLRQWWAFVWLEAVS